MKLLALIAISLVCTSNASLAEVPTAERDALVTLYNSTNGARWTPNTNWLTGDPCTDDWYGVTCDQSGSITKLELIINNLVGPIPPELSNLSNLQVLDLFDNKLNGPIPKTLGNLTKLRFLDLESNFLGGSIPNTLGNLTKLEDLWLGKNQLSGSIPAALGNLTNLLNLSLFEKINRSN